MGQLASQLSSRPQGSLPSTSETNPRREGKEQVNAIMVIDEEKPVVAPFPMKAKESDRALMRSLRKMLCSKITSSEPPPKEFSHTTFSPKVGETKRRKGERLSSLSRGTFQVACQYPIDGGSCQGTSICQVPSGFAEKEEEVGRLGS